jgi:hypothetical protein
MTNISDVTRADDFKIRFAHDYSFDAVVALVPFHMGETNHADLLNIQATPEDGLAARFAIARDALTAVSSEENYAAVVLGLLIRAAADKQEVTRADVVEHMKRNIHDFDSNTQQATLCAGIALGVAAHGGDKLYKETHSFKRLTGKAADDRRKLGQAKPWADTPLSPTALRKLIKSMPKPAPKADKADGDTGGAGDARTSDAGQEARKGKGGATPQDATARADKAAGVLRDVFGTLTNATVSDKAKVAFAQQGIEAAWLALGMDHADLTGVEGDAVSLPPMPALLAAE